MVGQLKLEPVELGNRKGLLEFVKVPWVLHKGELNLRLPLEMELLGSRLLGVTGLLEKSHPYHANAEVMHWVATRGSNLVGRISASLNQATLEKGKEFKDAGFFGFFESEENSETSGSLLNAAQTWLQARGCKRMMGPGGYSNMTHEPYQGIMVKGFDTSPSVELVWNPAYYERLMLGFGLERVMNYVTHEGRLDTAAKKGDERLIRLVQHSKEKIMKAGIRLRYVDKTQLESECQHIAEIYNEAWKTNWGFIPMSSSEVEHMAQSLKDIVVPELIQFAEKDGQPIGVIGGIPDPYSLNAPNWGRFQNIMNAEWVRRIRTLMGANKFLIKPTHLRVMFMGVRQTDRKTHIAASLFYNFLETSLAEGYLTADASLLLEHNKDVRAISEAWGLEHKKTYSIYAKQI